MSDLHPTRSPAPGLPDPAAQQYGRPDSYSYAPPTAGLERKLAFLRKFWWVPMLTFLLSVSAAIAYVLWMPPTYVSEAQMWETEKLRLPEGASFTEDLQNYYGTQMGLLQSDRMLQLALESLQAAGTNTVPHDADGKQFPVRIKVSQQPKSAVFMLEASSANPDYSQAFLNSLMAVFQNYKKNIRQTVSGTTFSSISDQVQRLELDLKTDQHALAAFQRTNNLAILQEEGTISGGYLARLRTELSDLQLESQLLEATALEQESAGVIGTNAAPYLLNTLRSTAASAALGNVERQTAFKELEMLKIQRDKLSRFFKARHPKIVKLDTDIDRVQKLLAFFRSQTRDQLASARQAIKMRIETAQTSIKDWETKVIEFKTRITEVERLKANVARSQSLYDRLMVLLENVDITRNINQETFAVLQPASIAECSHRKELMAIAMAAFLGLGLGSGLIFLVEFRDDRFTSLREVTDLFGDSIVGQVPEIRKLKRKKIALLLDDADNQPMLAESYRNLRSALLFLPGAADRPKVVLVTSALPSEGKSTIAANLAKAIALGGPRVLLIDADLRKGALHSVLSLKADPGLAELLANPSSSTPDKVAQTNCVPNLTFIARGITTTKHPGDLFLGATLDALLAQWRHEFDYVVIDSCPVFAADDVTTLAPKVDGTLFVVRRRYAGARAVREAIELLLHREAKVLGLVFNRADASSNSYYRYKHSDYYVKG